MGAAVSGRAWLDAMLAVEAALARAQARAGAIPAEAGAAITAACAAGALDAGEIGRDAAAAANPVVPMVEALRRSLPPEVSAHLHAGATSQDILDTAMMLLARDALALIDADMAGCTAACAALAERHRESLMAGRTLLQQAVPITFGLKAANWLVALVESRDRLARIAGTMLAIQLGGAGGTLDALGPNALVVAGYLAEELGLADPGFPWHTNRGRVAELAAALGIAVGAMGKVALDITLLAQSEVAEVTEGAGGRSSAMPNKRNPAGAINVRACVHRAHALVPLFFSSMLQEHERAAGAWQAEWESLAELFQLSAAAAAQLRAVVENLQVIEQRMLANVAASGGALSAEHVTTVLAEHMGSNEARELIDAIARRAQEQPTTFAEALRTDPAVAAHLSREELELALDPRAALGSTNALIDRALARHQRRGV